MVHSMCKKFIIKLEMGIGLVVYFVVFEGTIPQPWYMVTGSFWE